MKKYLLLLVALGGTFLLSANTFANTGFTDTLTTISNGWLDNVPVIMATPVGGFIYFVIGMLIIMTIVWVVMGIIKWGKKNMGQTHTQRKTTRRK